MTISKQGSSSNWIRHARDVVLAALVISAIVYWQTKDMLSSDGSVGVVQQNLVSLEGEVLPLLVEGKPNLIYFFAPWCTICALSIDNLEYLNSDKINVVVVALDYSSEQEVQQFVEEHQVLAKVLMGHDALKAQFQIQGYPSYYVISEEGVVSSRAFGYSTALGLKLREAFQ
ncbi:redoxin domain-containing protein [Glaciecola sp. SC05]|uniref:redoxin domain-containing protein n=1 Tax=Glaciecola sp. SC05 TaxID=1987355 RepID=UPI003528DD5F